ncbi:DUF1194 domain-containing protein [Sulfitobacter guttiformis]|uniref:Uncharacterized protein DUF1194 n=1 Tax=Sulfitobacter guttiformis TaxID=74349 RepID=A0A420DJZ0_9RHOB|nr:DUF1194 domain-containing protein [Sulfitobacter guttiformis]KIN71665.1 Von Willebrand factor type A domain protein [Sulfitobacter guttiformis KCTC 32187]RKE94505.1 uncharacterized protein DUF1194 [Sulfitobacter guttiformis]
MKAAALAAVLALCAAPALAQEACRQALVLALDVSGSVDAREYRLQIGGLAQALGSPAVRAALMEQPETPVELLVFEWSGPQDQMTLLPWTRIDSAEALDTVIAQLALTERRAEATPGTALGVAMAHGAYLLAQRSGCWRKTLDISGDGKSNLGPRPRTTKPRLEGAGITINGLVIGADNPASGDAHQREIGELSAYFAAEVILGADAFVEVALGFEGYAEAMERKLLRELDTLTLSMR